MSLIPSGNLLATVNTTQLTKAAPKDSGTIIAVDMSLGSFVHIVGPPISTYILMHFGYSSVLIVSSIMCCVLAACLRAEVL
ncbi:hypothetical protein CYMTET_52783 [Cymbomonas tetramitiformis]|uniref:Uncharacterized protein n=1 Tax=Cymbomonas tetramitiformis TaxID=36881 RepID=A0AAE0BK42_9CHLO|nr:hypothetical protein CYMTET_52783 [Cymbomonas tetramitiformis]